MRFVGSEGQEARRRLSNSIAADLKLSDDEQSELLRFGRSPVILIRSRWARFYLAREGLLDSSSSGVWSLTETRPGDPL